MTEPTCEFCGYTDKMRCRKIAFARNCQRYTDDVHAEIMKFLNRNGIRMHVREKAGRGIVEFRWRGSNIVIGGKLMKEIIERDTRFDASKVMSMYGSNK